MPPKSIVPDKCPDCGEVGSVTIDDSLGEICCNECGFVLQGGLEESSTTAYYDDQVHGAAALGQLRAGGNASGSGGPGDQVSYLAQVLSTLRTLSARFDAPASVLNDATVLAEDYLEKLADSGSGKPASHDCFGIALFHVSSLRMRFPLSQPQLLQELSAALPDKAPAVVRDLVNSLVRNMKLELPPPETVIKDLVALLVERMRQGTSSQDALQNPREPTLTMASTLASVYSDNVSTPAEQRVVAAASILISMTSRAAREQLAPRVVAALNAEQKQDAGGSAAAAVQIAVPNARQWAKEEMVALETTLARLIRDDSKALRSCIKMLMGNANVVLGWIAAAAKKFPAVTANTRRDRDE